MPTIVTIKDRFTREMIDAFRIATGDTNKLHQGERPITLGFQMAGRVKTDLDELAGEGMQYHSQKTKFSDKLYMDEPFTVYHSEISRTPDQVVYNAGIKRKSDGSTLAESTVTYATRLLQQPARTFAEPGKHYVVTPAILNGVREGLAAEQHDPVTAAISMASNALRTNTKNLDVLFNEEVEGHKYPYYVLHDFTVYDGARAALQSGAFWLHTENKGNRRQLYRAVVHGVNKQGTPLFDGNILLAFADK